MCYGQSSLNVTLEVTLSEVSVGNDATVQCRAVSPDTDNVVAGSIQLIGMYTYT